MASTRGARGVTLVVARRGPEGRARKRVLHHDADSDLRDFFSDQRGASYAKRVARTLGRCRIIHLSVEIARGDERQCVNCFDEGTNK